MFPSQGLFISVGVIEYLSSSPVLQSSAWRYVKWNEIAVLKHAFVSYIAKLLKVCNSRIFVHWFYDVLLKITCRLFIAQAVKEWFKLYKSKRIVIFVLLMLPRNNKKKQRKIKLCIHLGEPNFFGILLVIYFLQNGTIFSMQLSNDYTNRKEYGTFNLFAPLKTI